MRASPDQVVVGGGSAVVGFPGRPHNFFKDDLRSWYPELAHKFKIILVGALTNVLPIFSWELSRLLGDPGCEFNLERRSTASHLRLTRWIVSRQRVICANGSKWRLFKADPSLVSSVNKTRKQSSKRSSLNGVKRGARRGLSEGPESKLRVRDLCLFVAKSRKMY